MNLFFHQYFVLYHLVLYSLNVGIMSTLIQCDWTWWSRSRKLTCITEKGVCNTKKGHSRGSDFRSSKRQPSCTLAYHFQLISTMAGTRSFVEAARICHQCDKEIANIARKVCGGCRIICYCVSWNICTGLFLHRP